MVMPPAMPCCRISPTRCSAQVRDSDVVGRIGGDEFGVILSHANHMHGAPQGRDHLRDAERQSPAIWQGQPIPVAFSYGTFELVPGENADSAIARADEAMYAHKKGRRALVQAMISGSSSSSICVIWSLSCSLRFFRRVSRNWSAETGFDHRRDGRVEIVMFLFELGEPGAQRLLLSLGHR